MTRTSFWSRGPALRNRALRSRKMTFSLHDHDRGVVRLAQLGQVALFRMRKFEENPDADLRRESCCSFGSLSKSGRKKGSVDVFQE